ncbi:MAG: hypothetical protein J6X28_03010 [Bacilli bacterium]|nr:hypothetical protein [Bacilli bacterium]
MAKFVCDFGQVSAAGDKMISAASDLKTATTTYASNIESDLSGWNGDAKSSFMTTCNTQTAAATVEAQEMNDFGEFVKSSAQQIQELDDQLAAISI